MEFALSKKGVYAYWKRYLYERLNMGNYNKAGSAGRKGMAAIACLALLAASIMGCSEPITTYQVTRRCLSGDETVLVLPFMDTRTFVDSNDPHKDDLDDHARDIFVAAMRENTVGAETNLLTPTLAKQEKSMTNAEVAELGRQYGADVVVAGQIFSFTDTRAASIPPRAGMFVRVVSARDGALLFVGDHYQAAAIPGAGGGRDLQAKNVSVKLLEGICSQIAPTLAALDRIASGSALASVSAGDDARGNNRVGGDDYPDPMPLPPPIIGMSGGASLNPDEWGEQVAPDVPLVIDYNDDFYQLPYQEPLAAVPLPPPPLDNSDENDEADEQAFEMTETPLPPPAPADAIAIAADEADADHAAISENAKPDTGIEPPEFAANPLPPEKPAEPEVPAIADAFAEPEVPAMAEAVSDIDDDARADADMDDMLAEMEEPEPAVAEIPEPAPEPEAEMAEAVESSDPAVRVYDYNAWINSGYQDTPPLEPVNVSDMAQMSGDDLAADLFASEDSLLAESRSASRLPTITATGDSAEVMADEVTPVVAATYVSEPFELPESDENGPVYSTPLAVEQPRAYRTVDRVLPEDPEASAVLALPEMTTTIANRPTAPGAVRVLILPYHDRENPNNLIQNTGGGEVVTTLYGTQLSNDNGIQVMWDASGQASHDRLVDRVEALQLGKMVGADYVIRGQVVEFRRAQSVPSFYSAVISTAVLAAQIFFAEMSGVDVATEVYRVSDGMCVMSRRDRAQQKYVVQAEKTVRKLANGMAASVSKVVKEANPQEMDPLIDELAPMTFLSSAR